MNKFFLKMSLLTIIITTTGMNGSQFQNDNEKDLVELEDPIYSQISALKAIYNMHRLNDYAAQVSSSLPIHNKFSALSNKIDKDTSLTARLEAIRHFYICKDPAAVIKSACIAKIRNVFFAATALIAAPIGYYFYSKNK